MAWNGTPPGAIWLAKSGRQAVDPLVELELRGGCCGTGDSFTYERAVNPLDAPNKLGGFSHVFEKGASEYIRFGYDESTEDNRRVFEAINDAIAAGGSALTNLVFVLAQIPSFAVITAAAVGVRAMPAGMTVKLSFNNGQAFPTNLKKFNIPPGCNQDFGAGATASGFPDAIPAPDAGMLETVYTATTSGAQNVIANSNELQLRIMSAPTSGVVDALDLRIMLSWDVVYRPSI